MPPYVPGPQAQRVFRPLQERILSGDLGPGCKLPSHRELSQLYGVSPMTARVAISELEDQGLVVRRPRRGTFVRVDGAPRQSKPLPETIWQSIPDAIIVYALDGTIVSWNPAAERLYGFHADEIVGRHAAHLLLPEDLHVLSDALEEPRSGCHRTDPDAVRVRKDGSKVKVGVRMFPLRAEDGGTIGYVSLSHEVPTRQTAAGDACEAETRYRTLLDGAPIGISLADLQGNFLVANAAFQRLVGYVEEELLHMSYFDLTHPDDVEPDRTLFADAIAGLRTQYEVEKRYIRKSGEIVWVRLTVLVPRDSAGNPTYDIAMADDITEHRRAEEQIRETADALSEQELERDTVMNAIPHGVVVVDAAGKIMHMNDAGHTVLGVLPSSEVSLAEQAERAAAHERATGRPIRAGDEPISRALAGETVANFELGFRLPGEERERTIRISAAPLRRVDGSIRGAVVIFTDVSEERQLAEQLRTSVEALRSSEARYRSLVDASPDAVMLVREDGAILMANQQAAILHGCEDPAELIHLSSHILTDVEEEERYHFVDRLLTSGLVHSIEYVGVRRDGTRFTGELSARLVPHTGDAPQTAVIIARDITARKSVEERIRHLALHDELTDLPNRTQMSERAGEAIARAERDGRPLAILLVDLVRFGLINDTFGHSYGDLALEQIGKRLRRLVRKDDIVARVAGDEFAVLLNGTGEKDALQVAEVLLRGLEGPYEIGGHTVYIGARIGIALYPDHGADVQALLRQADVAMHAAARRGQTTGVFDPSRQDHVPDSLTLIADLRKALGGDELLMHYQPQLDMRTRRVHAVEALVRWCHPTKGWIPPSAFVGLAEDSGLIDPLTLWIFNATLAQCAAWKRSSTPRSVAVNLSVRSLGDDAIVDTIARSLRSWAVDPCLLTVEITETSFMHRPEAAMHVVTHLRDMGVRIAIDDFGAGYSSLAYLKRLPVDELKIDMSFVQGICRSKRDL